MPAWLHARAEHILRKNPQMPKSQAFAIATQQSHALGKSPKGYGTEEGRTEAKRKYKTPNDDTKTADPKEASAFWNGFFDELKKEAFAPIKPLPRLQGLSRQMAGANAGSFKGLTSTMKTPKPTPGTATPGPVSSAVAPGRSAGQTLGTSTTPSSPPVFS